MALPSALREWESAGLPAISGRKCSEQEYQLEPWWAGDILEEGGLGGGGKFSIRCCSLESGANVWQLGKHCVHSRITKTIWDLSHHELPSPPRTPRLLTFIGSGPLPLNPICLTILTISLAPRIHIDSSHHTITVSRSSLRVWAHPSPFEHADATSVEPDEFDVYSPGWWVAVARSGTF